ncbi:MAG: putative multicopper oxidase [Herbinix sp.]|jgi:FtsP/CotA-like multicopper oxidase with cupredoxin domain|nr:putative multicopper oxidase [Herbinix sp.]
MIYSAERLYSDMKNKICDFKYSIKNKSNKILFRRPTQLDPAKIPKYVNQLVKPEVYKPEVMNYHKKGNELKHCKETHCYRIDISEFKQQILPEGFPKTKVWGYGGYIKDSKTGQVKYSRSSPGSTIEAIRGIPVKVKWINKLKGKHLFAVDPTLHWANPNDMPMDPPKPWPQFPPGFIKAQIPVPTVTHLHGGEVASVNDGHPDAWFTYNHIFGPAYKKSINTYPNKQQPTTLWYHDHALGITRLNVYAGLAGFYLLRDGDRCKHDCLYPESQMNLPCGKYEIPIVIQDRMFNTDGSLRFTNVGDNPELHPYWDPEFFGDTIMVNGKVWPNLNVDRRQYRFRVLNGSNARFYNLKMSNGMHFIQIGSDGGFLSEPVELNSLLLAPAERADILVDFSEIEPGTSILLQNNANAPFPDGDSPDPNTVGQIMQFTIPFDAPEPIKPCMLPDRLNCITNLKPNTPKRILTLNEVTGPNGPTIVLLNGQKWSAPITETPRVGSTEEWCIVNLTMDTHPIHLHLVQFQLHNRQNFDMEEYQKKWEELNGILPLEQPTEVLPIDPYLLGKPIDPDENESGWKDTVRMNPGQVTRIWVRFAPQDTPNCQVSPGKNYYPFDPSSGPGYVWHCHIIDHEDNEMMRPYIVEK